MKKFILITGASGGIGQEIAYKLAGAGYSLYLHYNQNENSIQKLLKDLNEQYEDNEFIPIQADLLTSVGCTKLSHEIYQIDGIVHNSGLAISKLLTMMQADEINQLINLHLTAPIHITKNLLPKLLRNGNGNIVFISSIWGVTGGANETVYSAVKGGQIAFAKALSKEVAFNNIRVNVVAPGAIHTNMLSELSEDDRLLLEEEIPMGRLGTAKEVADCVEFLLSEKSSYVTGQVLNVNGGWYT